MRKQSLFCLSSALTLAASPLSAQKPERSAPAVSTSKEKDKHLVNFENDIFLDYDNGLVLGKKVSKDMDLALRFKRTGRGTEYKRDPYRIFNRDRREEYSITFRYRF